MTFVHFRSVRGKCWKVNDGDVITKCAQFEPTCCYFFKTAERQNVVEIHWNMNNVYGDACVLKSIVVEWCSNFWAGCDSTEDTNRSRRYKSVIHMLKIQIGHTHAMQTAANGHFVMQLGRSVAYPIVRFQKIQI